MRRVILGLVALAWCFASSARAFPAYDPELVERPPWRFLLDGGVTIPFDLPVGGYQVGGGLGLGLEFPQSDSHSFIVRGVRPCAPGSAVVSLR